MPGLVLFILGIWKRTSLNEMSVGQIEREMSELTSTGLINTFIIAH
jgi:hypothetical protein